MYETSLASQLRKKYQQQSHDENRPNNRAYEWASRPYAAISGDREQVLKVDRKDQVAGEH